MIWRRFHIHGGMSLGAFHFLLQFAFGWDNYHLHSFHIHGKDYGISYEGGLGFYDNPWTVSLASFQFENRDKFTYEYNFYRHWLLDIRIEAVESNVNKTMPFCLREAAIKWSAAPDMTPQTVLYRRPVAQFSNFQPKIVSSWLILALFQANFLISGRSRLCPYQLVNSNQVRQGE
nr:plasmid pRiA4b ORF-3 family protein [Providencia heimbachae]